MSDATLRLLPMQLEHSADTVRLYVTCMWVTVEVATYCTGLPNGTKGVEVQALQQLFSTSGTSLAC